MRNYRDLLLTSGVTAPFAASLLGRLTPGMVALALVFLVRAEGGSYAAAGLLTAAHSIGVGLASPLLGRLVDRVGQRPVLIPSSLAYGGLMTALALGVAAGWSLAVTLPLGVLAGATLPPVAPCARVVWGIMFRQDRDRRDAAYALDSTAVELGFLAGPLLTIAIVGAAGEIAGVIVAGGASAVGGLWYAATSAARLSEPHPEARPRGGALTSSGVVTVILAFAAGSLSFGVLEVAIPAIAELAGDRDAAGPIFSALAGGSLLGGLVYGARQWPGTLVQRFGWMGLGFAVGMALLPFASGLWWTGVMMFVGGLTLAPTVICAYQLVDDLARRGTTTEAMTWTNSANVAGAAAGAALAGIAIDGSGTTLALTIGAVGVAVAGAVALIRRDTLHAPTSDPAPQTREPAHA